MKYLISLRSKNNNGVDIIKHYETKNTLFSSINHTVGESIVSLLSHKF